MSQCRHEFDTQMNEGMNNSVAFYANKGSNYCGTTSLLTRVMTAAGIQLLGHHRFWTTALDMLHVTATPQLECFLLDQDKRNVAKYFRNHDHKNMARRNKLYHEKFRDEYVKSQQDAKRNAVYKSKTGCDVRVGTNECVHRMFGCGGNKKHKTGRSKSCLYHGVGADTLSTTKAA